MEFPSHYLLSYLLTYYIRYAEKPTDTDCIYLGQSRPEPPNPPEQRRSEYPAQGYYQIARSKLRHVRTYVFVFVVSVSMALSSLAARVAVWPCCRRLAAAKICGRPCGRAPSSPRAPLARANVPSSSSPGTVTGTVTVTGAVGRGEINLLHLPIVQVRVLGCALET